MYVWIWLACGPVAGAVTFEIARGPQWGVVGDLTLGLLGATLGGWLLYATRLVSPSHLLAHAAVAIAGATCALVAMRAVISLAWRASAVAFGAREAESTPSLEASVARRALASATSWGTSCDASASPGTRTPPSRSS